VKEKYLVRDGARQGAIDGDVEEVAQAQLADVS